MHGTEDSHLTLVSSLLCDKKKKKIQQLKGQKIYMAHGYSSQFRTLAGT